MLEGLTQTTHTIILARTRAD